MTKRIRGVVLSWRGVLSCAALGVLSVLDASHAQAAVGRTAGSFSVSPSGSATYTIPIFTPPGQRGLQPSVALVYNSSGGVGYLGRGWSLSGLSALGRCNLTVAQDGGAQSVGLQTSDGYCLDGKRLRLVSGTYGASGSVYATEVADFSRITADGTTGNGPTSWTVERKDGLIHIYGGTSDSRVLGTPVSGPSTVSTWRLSQIKDRAGNKILFSYKSPDATTTGTTHPTVISWARTSSSSDTYLYTMEFGYGVDDNTPPSSPAGYVVENPVRDTDLLTSISIKQSGVMVRKYVLAYDPSPTTGATLLTTVTECDGNMDCLAATEITYQQGQVGIETSPSFTQSDNIIAVNGELDYNGDGLLDLAYRRDGNLYVRFASTSGYGIEILTGVDAFTVMGGDPFGNGRDVLMGFNGTTTWHAYIWNESTSAFMPVSTGIAYAETSGNGWFHEVALADVDGDGKDDIVYTEQTVDMDAMVMNARISDSTGSMLSFTDHIRNYYTPEPPLEDGYLAYGIPNGVHTQARWFLGDVDVDGNGTEDVMVDGEVFYCFGDPYYDCWMYAYSAAVGLQRQSPAVSEFSQLAGSFLNLFTPASFNSDGCTDLAANRNAHYATPFAYRARCGAGADSTSATAGDLKGLIDWDGDGRQDVLVQLTGYSTLHVQRSTGVGLAAPESASVPSGCYAYQTHMYLTDANGDGLGDLICLHTGNSINVYLHKGATEHPDLAVTFADGYGVEHEVTYAISTHEGYESNSDAVYPQQDVTRPRVLVREVASSDGLGDMHTTVYSYFGATRDVQGRGFQGFERIESVNDRNEDDLKHVRTFKRDFPYTGMLVGEEVRQKNGTPIRLRTVTPDQDILDNTVNNKRYFPYPDSSVEEVHEVDGGSDGDLITRIEVSNTFGDHGNLVASTRTTTDKDAGSSAYGLYDQSWTVVIENSFSPNVTAWCLGLPTAVSVTSSTSLSEPTVVRSSSFVPDYGYCRMSEETVEPGDPLRKVKSAYEYDAFGNVTKVTVTGQDSGGNPMAPRVHETKWGSANGTIGGTGQFLVAEIDALGKTTTRTFHPTFGSLLTETDPNSILVVENAYDGFGRPVRSERADGTATDFDYHACTVSGTYACENGDPSSGVGTNRMIVVATERDTGNGAIRDDWTYLDQFDRPVVEKSRTASGAYSRVGTEYDVYGRVSRKSAPCNVSSCSYYWVTNLYDLLGRLVQQSRPLSDGFSTPVTTTFLHEGRKQKITDPRGKETIKVLDVNGWVRRSQDHGGYYQLFSYDGAGSLIKVTDSLSNDLFSAEYSYGIQAFQDVTTDMDLGGWSYTYNSLGELVGWTDAKSQSFSQTFDVLSRVTSRTEPEGTTSFTFGTSAGSHNIGRLASVSMTGYTESFTYDSAGRLSGRAITTDQPYDIDYAYNNQGLLDTLTYPTSTFSTRLKVKYGYAHGILSTVTDWTAGSAGTVYWTANAHNARGQTTLETLGNGVITERSFDAVTGWLNSIASGLSGGPGLQNLGYQYDQIGNVTQRQENSLGLTESFYYDDLHRLTSSTLNSVPNLTLTYNAMGNITSRSDVNGGASWTYHGTKKHAVTSTGTGGATFGYDANGNMTSRAGETITWSSYNYPTGLSTGTESATFHYGPDRQYYKQEYSGPGGTEITHYVGGILEKVYDGTTEDWRHTIRAGGQVVAIVSRKASGPVATHYALGDNQGSGSTLVDSAGSGYVRQSYGAFGLPRDGNDWDGAVPSADQGTINAITRRGYTGHSMLGAMGLIHMNGRVHDAILGRFLSPDPYVPNPGHTQSFNRYAYVNNNPLSFIDPSGFQETGSGRGVLDVLQEVLVSGASEGCGRLTGYENSICLALVNWVEALGVSDVMCLMVGGLACSQDHFAQAVEPEEQYAGAGSYSRGPATRVARGASRSQPAPSTALSTQPQGSLGTIGNVLRSQLDTDLERGAFDRYWLGRGDLALSQSQFESIASALSLTTVAMGDGMYNFVQDGNNYYAYKRDFYGTEHDGLLGRAWVIYDAGGGPVGLFDRYDFNSKPWADRSISGHFQTWGVRQASRFCESCKPYNVTYGIYSDMLP